MDALRLGCTHAFALGTSLAAAAPATDLSTLHKHAELSTYPITRQEKKELSFRFSELTNQNNFLLIGEHKAL
uniref:Uncharacterized protein n=1 Tax=Oryza brachyantha TaxID=4533 RepID=J3LAP8_ORYBR